MGTNQITLPAGFVLDGQTQGLPPGFVLDNAQQAQPNQSWGDVATKAAVNFIPSTANMVKGAATSLLHPIDTISNLGKLTVGAGENIAEGLAKKVNPELVAFNRQLNPPNQPQQMASDVGNFYKNRYGSMEGFKNAVATDPAGVMADASTILTAGGSAASKIPMLGKAGQTAVTAGNAINPLTIAWKAAGKATDLGKALTAGGLGMTTGAGYKAIEEAYGAGKVGGTKQTIFIDNLRGKVAKDSVLDAVDANIQAMGKAKSEAYKAGMANLGQNQQVLNYGDIVNAANDAMKVQTYTGKNTGQVVSTARSTLGMQKQVAKLINEWKKLDPTDFHTAEGLDALKKNIGDLRDSTQYGTPERLVADKVYHAVKNQIVKQAPDYAKTMKDYQQASDLMSEIRATLSNKPTASVDTQMRKLQSLMRNNVNTNYGNRLDLVKQLEQQGGNEVLPAVAGQALNTWTPRGLQSASTIPTSLMVGLANPFLGIATLGAASPRSMGELSLLAGRTARYANKPVGTVNRLSELLNTNPAALANYFYQANQPK